VGAELISCDGRSPERLVAEDVLPYFGLLSSHEQGLIGLPAVPNPRMTSLRYALYAASGWRMGRSAHSRSATSPWAAL